MHSAPIDMNARVTAFAALSAYRIGSLRCEVRERSAYAAIIVADSKNRWYVITGSPKIRNSTLNHSAARCDRIAANNQQAAPSKIASSQKEAHTSVRARRTAPRAKDKLKRCCAWSCYQLAQSNTSADSKRPAQANVRAIEQLPRKGQNRTAGELDADSRVTH